jgi:hypothetical protein
VQQADPGNNLGRVCRGGAVSVDRPVGDPVRSVRVRFESGVAEGGSIAASIASRHGAAVICFTRKTATLSAKVDKSARLWNRPTLVETDPFGRTHLS